MQPDKLLRLFPLSLLVSLAAGVVLYIVSDAKAAVGFLVGGIWSTCNLWALYILFQEVFFHTRPLMIFLLAQLKIPLLYGAGYLAVANLEMNLVWAVVGFHIPILLVLIGAFYNFSAPNERPVED